MIEMTEENKQIKEVYKKIFNRLARITEQPREEYKNVDGIFDFIEICQSKLQDQD